MFNTPLDPDSWQVREVYAHFGLACYTAQVLEHGMVNLLVICGIVDGNVTSAEEVDRQYDDLFKKTFGKLKNELSTSRELVSEVEGLLHRALKIRNHLAHAYFRERSVDFTRGVGRLGMIAELKQVQEFLSAVDREIDKLTREASRVFDPSGKRLQEAVDSLESQPLDSVNFPGLQI